MPTTGYIQLQFNAAYLGDYRVCWREGISDPYTCFTVNCGSIGLCTVFITPISFATNTCDPIDYNGYVQASCEDPETTNGAVFWTSEYEPVTDCKPWEITCQGVTIPQSIDIDVKASGTLAFQANNLSGEPDQPNTPFGCLCNLNPLWNANSIYNTNLVISPWGTTPIKVTAWNAAGGNSGNYNWGPGTIFCGKFSGGLGFQTAISSISPDPCGVDTGPVAANGAQFGADCIYKPIIIIAPPPGPGVQATAEAVMGLGGITPGTPINILNTGTNTGTPGVYNAWNQTIGSNRGRGFFQVVVSAATQKVSSVIPLATPYGYYFRSGVNEQFTFNPADIGGVTGVVAEKPAGINTTDYGKVIDVVVTNQGSGYVSPPMVSIVTTFCYNPTPVNVSLQLTQVTGGTGPCPSFIPGDGCGTYPDDISPTIPSLPVGTSFILCYPNNVVNPPWTLNEDHWNIDNSVNACCYDCVALSVTGTGDNPTPQITYTNCDTQNVVVTTLTPAGLNIPCAVNGSWASTATDTIFTVTGPCTT